MPRRAADTITISVWLTVREGLILDEIRAMLAIDSNANLVRAALFMYAKHCNVHNLHYSDFGIRKKGEEPRRADKKPPAPQFLAPAIAAAVAKVEDQFLARLKSSTKQARNKPRADHPWRQYRGPREKPKP